MDNAAYVTDGAADSGSAPAARTASTPGGAGSPVRRRQKEEEPPPPGDATVQLPRTIGLLSGSTIVISTVIGAGIFITPAGVLRHSGSVAAALIIWLACGIVEVIGAFCYIELGLLIPEHGGVFTYLLRAFGSLHPFLGPLPAFLHSWQDVNVANAAGMAVLSLAFAQNCVRPWYGDCEPSAGLEPAVAMLAMVTFSAANYVDVIWATRLHMVSMFGKIGAMAIIVVGGLYSLARGNTQHLATGFQGTTNSPGEMAAAFFSCLWTYGGWSVLNNITEEVKNPPRTLPLAILCSLPLIVIFYTLTNVAYLAVLSPQEMLTSPAVAYTFGKRVLGPAAFLMPLGVALSVCGGLNSAILTSSRVTLAVARRGHHVQALGLVHAYRLTPLPALIFNTVLTCLMISIGNIGVMLQLGSFLNAFFNVLVLVGLLVMRRTMAQAERPFRVPTVLAWLRLVFCAYLLISPIVDHPRVEYLYGLAMIALGLVVYTPCVYYRRSPSFLKRWTIILQKALEVLPTECSVD